MTATAPSSTPYDEVPYPGLAHAPAHPDRLATIATLLGLDPPAVEHCSVLELGCGNGTNLIAMAYTLPHARFFGIDAAVAPPAEAARAIAELGLTNVRIEQQDIIDFDADGATYDYIIAHGVYSWVPAEVRDRLLAICGARLAPRGVAYVSYNTYPGGHLRDMVREMMLFHVRQIADGRERIRQARALLEFLAAARTEPDLYGRLIQHELDHVREYSDGAFFHDDLNPQTRPCYFHEFAAHAASHGLRFLGEAVFNEVRPEEFTPAALDEIRRLDDDPLTREQYLDFLMARRFRRTLLCRWDVPLDYKLVPDAVSRLYAASEARPVSERPDFAGGAVEEFRTARAAALRTSRPLLKAALAHLRRHWPGGVAFADLLAAARRLAPGEAAADPDGAENACALRDLLLRAYAAGVVELHTWLPALAASVSNRPAASPVARWQARRGPRITSLRHTGLELRDELSRRLLDLLDGSRSLAEIEDALVDCVERGGAALVADGRPVTGAAQVRAIIRRDLPQTLANFAEAAVLVR